MSLATLAACAAVAGTYFAFRHRGAPHDARRIVLACLGVAILLVQAALAPWGAELRTMVERTPLAAPHETLGGRDTGGFCSFTCPWAEVWGYFEGVEDDEAFIAGFVPRQQALLERHGWTTEAVDDGWEDGERRPCVTGCTMRFSRGDTYHLSLFIGEAAYGGHDFLLANIRSQIPPDGLGFEIVLGA